MRRPTREEMRAARAVLACADCGAGVGVQCKHPDNANPKQGGIPDHVSRTFLWRADQAPELDQTAALALLRLPVTGGTVVVGGGLGWYLRADVLLKSLRGKVPTVAVYLVGAGGTVAQRERLRLDMVERACDAGWLIPTTYGRTEYTPTPRGIEAATRYALALGVAWERLPTPPVRRALTPEQLASRTAYQSLWVQWTDNPAAPEPTSTKVRGHIRHRP